MKSDAEIATAVEALKAWFISQELSPGEAARCLIQLVAQQLVANSPSKSLSDLNMGINLFTNQLTMQIAQYLEESREA